jgi:hypothetical protein
MDQRRIESAIAAEAVAHAEAAAELNPYGEAESLEVGAASLVYSGSLSPVHGVFALGLGGCPDERDWQEIDKFFSRKERPPAFWLTPFTDPAVSDRLKHSHRPTRTVAVRALSLPQDPAPPPDAALSGPDHQAWSAAFGRKHQELLALTKLHQRNTRFYLQETEASYTFFHQGVALIPFPAAALLPLQRKECFHSKEIVVIGEADLPLLYERTLYEPV